MRALLSIFFALSVTVVASENDPFPDAREHIPVLRDFWLHMHASWWNPQLGMLSPRVSKYCQEYARRHAPEAVIPQVFADLQQHPTEFNDAVYTYVLAQWPRKKVLQIIQPYRHSRDPFIRETAEEFHDDLLSWNTKET